jgi:hypothetical protein
MNGKTAVAVVCGLLAAPAMAMQGSANSEEGYSFGSGETLRMNGKQQAPSPQAATPAGGASQKSSPTASTQGEAAGAKDKAAKTPKHKKAKARKPKAKKPSASKTPKKSKKPSASLMGEQGRTGGVQEDHPGVSRNVTPRVLL